MSKNLKLAQSPAAEDVLRHHIDADVVLVGQQVEEPRCGHLEFDDDGVGIGCRNAVEGLLDVDAPTHLCPELVQGRQRVDHVIGAERLAVAPLDAAAQLDRELFEVGLYS